MERRCQPYMVAPPSRAARSLSRTTISAISRRKRPLKESGSVATTLPNYMKRKRRRRLITVARNRRETPDERLVFEASQKTVWSLSLVLILIRQHSRETRLILETAPAAQSAAQILSQSLTPRVAWSKISQPLGGLPHLKANLRKCLCAMHLISRVRLRSSNVM